MPHSPEENANKNLEKNPAATRNRTHDLGRNIVDHLLQNQVGGCIVDGVEWGGD